MSPRFIRPKVSCKSISVISLVLGLLFFSGNSLPVRLEFDDEDILDLSHPFNNQTVYYPTMEQLGFTFQLGTVFRGLNKQGNYHSAYWFQAAEHGGTHVDAPSHNQING
jgi:Putative cyclase